MMGILDRIYSYEYKWDDDMELKIRGCLYFIEALIKKSVVYLNEELWVRGFAMDGRNLTLDEKVFSLRESVELARREWEQARALFEEAKEPDLVDHAIYAMDAAERKYMYLLKRAKEEKVIDTSYYQIKEDGLA